MLHCDHWSQHRIPHFKHFGLESHALPKHLLKMQIFSQNLKPGKLSEARRDFRPCFPLWGPGPSLSLASTTAPFESKSSAAFCSPPAAALWSGVWPQGVWPRGRRDAETTKVVGMLSSTSVQPTNDRWIFWTPHPQIYSKKKHSQTHWTNFNIITFFLQLTLPSMKRYVVKNNVVNYIN